MTSRVQLSLFLSAESAGPVEAARQVLDPVQFNLIPAHVTLCREDELGGITPALLRRRLEVRPATPIVLTFGSPVPFSTHGVLLPCISGEDGFRALRHMILRSDTIKRQRAHITLAHPRNPKAASSGLTVAAALGSGDGHVHNRLPHSTARWLSVAGS
jgi:hypothetical protein